MSKKNKKKRLTGKAEIDPIDGLLKLRIAHGYKTELDPNNEQVSALMQHAGAARFAYNWGLGRFVEEYRSTGKTLTAVDLHKELNALKKLPIEEGGFPWMMDVSKCPMQEALRNLEAARDNFFLRCEKKVKKKGFPRRKTRKKGIGSFTLTGAIHVHDGAVQLPRLGTIRLKEHGYLLDEVLPVAAHDGIAAIAGVHILKAVVSEKAGRWFVSIQTEETIIVEKAPERTIGVDVGLKNLAVTSDGEVFANYKALWHAERRLRMLSKAVSRKVKGSKNREKAKRMLAKQHFRVACIRKDMIHKATTAISKQASTIVIESLNVAGMMKNHCLARAIGDAGLAEFHRQLMYKVVNRGGTIVKADLFYPSSKTCSDCGAVNPDLKLSDRIFVCPVCGMTKDRDLNAAINLKRWPEVSVASLACRPGSSGRSPQLGPTKLLVGQEPNTINPRGIDG